MSSNVSPGIPAWQRGRVASWLVTVDHKRIGILYIGTAGFFFALSGFLALLIRTQLAQADQTILTGNSYNEAVTMHGTAMIFFVVHADPGRARQLPRAADDRRPRHGVSAAERALVLALLFGGLILASLLRRAARRTPAGSPTRRSPSTLSHGQRPATYWILALHILRHRHDRWAHQLHRHHREACARRA